MSEPSASVLLPVNNRSNSFAQAIASILSLNPPPDELIFVDNGSEEALSPILHQYAGMIFMHRKPSGRVASVQNAGSRLVKDKCLTFIDTDKEWVPGNIDAQYRDLLAAQSEIFRMRFKNF